MTAGYHMAMEKASDDNLRFDLERGADGKLKAAWLLVGKDRTEIRLMAEDPNLGRLITWILKTRQDVSGFEQLPKAGTFVTCEEQLIDRAKDKQFHFPILARNDGRRLATSYVDNPPEAGRVKLYFSQELNESVRTISFFQLYAIAPSEVSQRKIPGEQEIGHRPTGMFAPAQLLGELEKGLINDDSEIRRRSDYPVTRTFVYIDLSDFSQKPMQHQLISIVDLGKVLRSALFAGYQPPAATGPLDSLESSLCIGDGYILVYRSAWEACFRACLLAEVIEQLIAKSLIIDLHFRIAVHTGDVCRFWDAVPGAPERWNYVGAGIIDTQRVLDAMGKTQDDVVYISAEARRVAREENERRNTQDPVEQHLINRGRHVDKHGVPHRIYEANHSAWMKNRTNSLEYLWKSQFGA